MIFKTVTLTWKGKTYEVAPDQVMRLIAQIEDVITLTELLNPRGRPLAKISMAYGAALRYAGAQVRDDEIYESMFTSGVSAEASASAVSGLLSMMLPPSSVEAAASSKKAEPPAAATSS